jgi:hypothetical protein
MWSKWFSWREEMSIRKAGIALNRLMTATVTVTLRLKVHSDQ